MLDLAKLGVDALTVDADAFILREPWQVRLRVRVRVPPTLILTLTLTLTLTSTSSATRVPTC